MFGTSLIADDKSEYVTEGWDFEVIPVMFY